MGSDEVFTLFQSGWSGAPAAQTAPLAKRIDTTGRPVEGCAHISQDENGLDYPLCRYGRYLLDEEDAYSVATLSNDLRIVDLNRADVTFYRSGQYALIGDRKGAAVRVVKNRAAILELRGASIDTLTVEANAVV